MKELFELYTKSQDERNIEEIEKEVSEIMNRNNYGFDQLARYAVKINDNTNILIELDIPETKEDTTIFLTAYEYNGELEDYNCNNEIACIDFNGDWNNLKNEMIHFTEELITAIKS